MHKHYEHLACSWICDNKFLMSFSFCYYVYRFVDFNKFSLKKGCAKHNNTALNRILLHFAWSLSKKQSGNFFLLKHFVETTHYGPNE